LSGLTWRALWTQMASSSCQSTRALSRPIIAAAATTSKSSSRCTIREINQGCPSKRSWMQHPVEQGRDRSACSALALCDRQVAALPATRLQSRSSMQTVLAPLVPHHRCFTLYVESRFAAVSACLLSLNFIPYDNLRPQRACSFIYARAPCLRLKCTWNSF